MKISDLEKLFKRLKKKNAVILLILAVTFVYILFDQRGLIQRVQLSEEKSTLESRIRDLQKENDSMRTEIEKLQKSDQEIERIAREKYFMHRNGEKVIKVEPK
ncbi:MAG: septum formation initiator family protein [Candidatus Kryptoniota bacterium]